MAAPWPPQYGQAQSQVYHFNMAQQPGFQPQVPQHSQQAYGNQIYHQPQPYEQQPQQYPQQPMNFTGYGQLHQPASCYPQQQPPHQMPIPQQYQYGPPEQQPPSHQIPNQPPLHLSGVPQHTQAPPNPGAQANQYGPGQQHQQSQQSFAQQQLSHSPTQSLNQWQQPQKASTPQQHQYGPPQSPVKQESPGKKQSPGPTASPEKDQTQEKKPSVPCFNCGSFDHWAVSCPEPLREVPAGIANRQNQQPPAKRQKFNAPIITRYQVPHHMAQAAHQPQSFPPPPYSHLGYAQIPPQYQVPPTPISAQSPPGGQWPQAAPYPIQQQPHAGYPPQAPPPPPHQYSYAPTPQTPTQYYGPSPASQDSLQGPPQVSPANPPYAQPHQLQQSPAVQTFSGASQYPTLPSPAGVPPSGVQIFQQPHAQLANSTTVCQGPSSSISATRSQASTPKSKPADPGATQDDFDDLSILDVPDHPAAEGGPKPTLVGRPLPTNFVVADALAPFDAPALGDNGRCKSKYFEKSDISEENQNIRDTEDWEKYQKDPIFSDIGSGGNVILLSVLDMIFRPACMQEAGEESEALPLEPTDRSPSEADHRDHSSNESPLGCSVNGRQGSSASGGEHNVVPEQKSLPSTPHDQASGNATEDVLTSPGVTGTPKSVKIVQRPYPPPTPKDRTGDNGHLSRSRSASPRRYESHSYQNISPPDSGADGQPRNEEPATERHQPYYKEDASRHRSEKPGNQRFQRLPPPPPPPPIRRPSVYEGPNRSPLSPESIHVNPDGSGPDSHMQNGNSASYHQYPPDDYVTSPVRLRTQRSYGHKREYGNREESPDEDETIRRRQADDWTPKRKKRQPKVADAYNRRW